MRKPKSEFLSVLGVLFELWKLIVEAVRTRGGGDDHFRNLLSPQGGQIVGRIADLIVEGGSATKPFSAAANFFGRAKVMISHRENQFTAWFQNLVESSPLQGELKPFTFPKAMNDNEILAKLGGEQAAIASLAQVWQLLERQSAGEDGVLLTNGYANLFYVRDSKGKPRVVNVNWNDDGWNVNANSLDDNRWNDGNRVFSATADSLLR